MTLTDLVKDLPEPKVIDGARTTIRKALKESGKRLVVVDDDPTGTI